MNSRLIRALLLAAVVLSAACTSTPTRSLTYIKTSLLAIESYRWKDVPAPPDVSPGVIALSRQAIEREAEERGWVKVEQGAHAVLVLRFGWGRPIDVSKHGYEYYPGVRYSSGEDLRITRYERGTVVMDIVDPRLEKLLWRGAAEDAFKAKMSPQERKRAIDRAVESIFKKLPKK